MAFRTYSRTCGFAVPTVGDLIPPGSAPGRERRTPLAPTPLAAAPRDRAVIEERDDQAGHRRRRGSRGGRPPASDRDGYRGRTVVER
ncbi:conserved hypothetical protein (plasmid) [Rhodococcus jostii RHA1]|uniref:Uncharacterized protein n=1 Tax=Rhodococcus jostii (strain RHA1) TaxID=101510 RepID=Q0RX89_RHOJR|nr:conserved hypothetical protein [Rhodococcus jostii RHA1]